VPFRDPTGAKGLWGAFSPAPAHRHVAYQVPLAHWRGRPFSIAFLSDLHLGSHAGDIPRLTRILGEIERQAPDLVLLGGDHMNMMAFGGGRIPPETIAGVLAKLRLPMATVLGNHDWEYGLEAVTAAFEAAGIAVLENRVLSLAIDGVPLRIVGLSDDIHGRPDASLVGRSQEAEIVVSHDPGIMRDLPDGSVLLAGHVHAGQIRIPGLPILHMPRSRIPRLKGHGYHRIGHGHLVVSAGLGCSGIPLRLFAPPEVVTVTFLAEAAA
jgi:uncharacterized protein